MYKTTTLAPQLNPWQLGAVMPAGIAFEVSEAAVAPAAVEPVAAEPVKQVRAGERVTDRYAEPDPAIAAEETLLKEQPAEPTTIEPEHSPDFEAGFEAALEQLAAYDRFETEIREREAVFERLGEQLGMPAAQVQQALEEQARQQLFVQAQQQVASAELQQRMASLHRERTEIVDGTLTHLEGEVGEFDHAEAIQEAQRLAQERPELAEDPRALLRMAASTSAERLAEGNSVVDDAIARINRYIGADEEQIRWAAERAFDPSADDPGAAVVEALRDAFEAVPKPVKIGTRVTDRYAELSQIHRELADQTPPPREERKVQLRDSGQLRDGQGRFISAERVTDRYRREAGEAEQEQRRLAAHQRLMRSKGLL